ncbi:hypothetical protein EI555_006725 [Monodon monoceros]|uniref:Uncharacterized protein n=1 Tax=Monodon monoceros TaxID=40151 RepID=A0A4V5PA46_MONMO|nr:hypothetical protein EI555_006725 [Monodon monoceros]
MKARRSLRVALESPWEQDQGCGEGRALSPVGEERDRGRLEGAETARDREAPEAGGAAAAAAAEEHEPPHARTGRGLAAAEQDIPHELGRCGRGHAGGGCPAPPCPFTGSTARLLDLENRQ